MTEQATAKTILFKNAQMSLNAALNGLKSMVNPYSLIVAAIVAVGYAIYKVVTYQNEAEF